MLNLALVALLLGAPVAFSPDGDRNGSQDGDKTVQAEATVAENAEDEVITGDTFAFGSPSALAPIKMWAAYGYGVTDRFFDRAGNTQNLPFEITTQRVHVGAQINFLNTSNFQVGVGGQLNIGSSSLSNDMSSGFGLQGVKAYVSARGDVLGVHGGYFFDLGQEDDASGLSTSPFRQNAIFGGASFDYAPGMLRLFAGLDYYNLQENVDETRPAGNDLMFWKLGAGLKLGFLELGAAAQVRSQIVRTNLGMGGGHHGSLIPYLNISPAGLPASISVRGAVVDQYGEYGFALGGSNEFRSKFGFTVGLSVGFD
ncbi:hypothetical protein BH23BAC4_BH23BAC4_05360 [soil metagenome]